MLLALSAFAQAPVEARVTLAPPEIPFHKQAVFTITVEAPAELDVQLPDMTDKFGGVSVYGEPATQLVDLKGGRRRTTVSYTLDALKTGDYVIQPVEITWPPDGRLVLPSPVLRVRDLTPEEEASAAQLLSIVEPEPPGPGLLRQWWVWALVGATVLALALALFWRYRRRGEPPAPATPVLTPWEQAYARLDRLQSTGWSESGEYEPYYVELSSILREYIEGRYHIHAPEQTTPEFLAEAVGCGWFSPEHQKLLAGVLRHSDRVKFARHEPTAEEMDRHFAEVRQFVDETVPRHEPASEEAAA
jgi:hypothetical protein